jgi:hypothetical protein
MITAASDSRPYDIAGGNSHIVDYQGHVLGQISGARYIPAGESAADDDWERVREPWSPPGGD